MSQSPARIVLVRARELIQSPDDWVQGAWTIAGSDGRVRRCAYQAIRDAALESGLPDGPALKALTAVVADARRSPRRAIPAFNDMVDHSEVIAMLDRAITTV
jgi:hypothetical protein